MFLLGEKKLLLAKVRALAELHGPELLGEPFVLVVVLIAGVTIRLVREVKQMIKVGLAPIL